MIKIPWNESKADWRIRPDILLCPNVPKPMHGVAPRVVLGRSWWDKTRKAAYASTKYHCQACGVPKNQAKFRQHLEAHEIYKIDYSLGEMVYVEAVPLCNACHSYIHDGRMLNLLDKRQISHARYKSVIDHGDRVLAQAGLKRLSHQEREREVELLASQNLLAKWEDWRLVLFGERYPPKYANYEEWSKANEIVGFRSDGNRPVSRGIAIFRELLRRRSG